MSLESRRNFLFSSGKLLVGTAAFGSLIAHSSEKYVHMRGDSGDGHAIDAMAKNTCATCQFWGGMRKISGDKKQVIAQSMGWCNNPYSPNYKMLTMADNEMKKPNIWKKWPAL
jgi:hypothetical protein